MNKKITQKIVLRYDEHNSKFFIDGKEVDEDTWTKCKSLWDTECSYNHLPNFVKKWGFTSCDIDIKTNTLIYTTIKEDNNENLVSYKI